MNSPHETIDVLWPRESGPFSLKLDERLVERHRTVAALIGANLERTEVLRQKYDAVTIKDLRTILDIDWEVIDRLERKHVIEPFPVEEPNSWHMVKRSQIPAIKAYLEEEGRRKIQRKAERDAQKREPRITL